MQHSRFLLCPDPDFAKLRVHQPAVIYKELDLIRRKSDILQKSSRHRQHLSVRLDEVTADLVDIPLEKLARAPLLRSFIAPEWTKRPPPQREGKLVLPGSDHARESGRQFGTKRDGVAAAVIENKGLLFHELLTGLGGIEIDCLQAWTVVHLVSISLRSFSQLADQPLTLCHLIGIKITRTLDTLNHILHVDLF